MRMLEKVKGWLIVAGLFISGLLVVFFRGKREGQEETKAQQQADAFHEHVDAEEKVNAAKQHVEAKSDPDVESELSEWVRNPRDK